MRYYNLDDGKELESRRVKLKRTALIISSVTLAAAIVLLFFANPKNALWIIIVSAVIAVFSGWFFIFTYYSEYLPLKKRVDVYEKCLSSNERRYTGKVISADKTVTLTGGIAAYEVVFAVHGEQKASDNVPGKKNAADNKGDMIEKIFLFEAELGDFPYKAGDELVLYVSGGFVTAITEIKVSGGNKSGDTENADGNKNETRETE
ncbi:MAG: hypothetical protein HP008_01155 [Clostridia bacterium]|nr:hypothetical protein [Clostridia bacterium]